MKRKLFGSAISLGGIALVWLVFLPWLGAQPAVRQHIERLDAADVNASAMFYTELECQYRLQK